MQATHGLQICKGIPKQPVFLACCNQILGCDQCYLNATDMEFICPNSQSHEVATYPVKGLDEVYNQLRKAAVETDDSAYHF